MNFKQATNYDILQSTRSDELDELSAAIVKLNEYGEMTDEFADNKAVELILNNEPLELWEVEQFAGENGLYKSEKDFKGWFGFIQHDNFDVFKKLEFESGSLHQLQYDKYKYVG